MGLSFNQRDADNRLMVVGPNGGPATQVVSSADGLRFNFQPTELKRIWVRGPKANTSETFLVVPGKPHGIRRNSRGEFWVAVTNVLGRPPPTLPMLLLVGQRVNEQGQVLQEVPFAAGLGTEAVSEVQEFNFALYTGSLHVSFVASSRP
ncbi:hypothetical protein FNV43_RR20702 [Rhamnella rubrinervis]|uniref:Strictosidine synthase conserved region domain-containing protein n=1 Tax=Rhamnella rubrinervis TaxID=2594499 RepID=A0A8K0DWF4_9ROSA|nr:hypothetical protein FNV43_RR20702 [Rhamnella rubrinervis]